MDARYRTAVYIDGFNFYYGQVKGTRWKWLDLESFFLKVLGQQHSSALRSSQLPEKIPGTGIHKPTGW